MIKQHMVPVSKCTNCGEELDRMMSVTSRAQPDPGSYTICYKCSHLMVMGYDFKLRNPTNEELKDIAGNIDLLRTMRIIKLAHAAADKEKQDGK